MKNSNIVTRIIILPVVAVVGTDVTVLTVLTVGVVAVVADSVVNVVGALVLSTTHKHTRAVLRIVPSKHGKLTTGNVSAYFGKTFNKRPSKNCLSRTICEHKELLNRYSNDIVQSCIDAACSSIPMTGQNTNKSIPGWSEHVAPLREKSMFWHNLWVACGRPRTGV